MKGTPKHVASRSECWWWCARHRTERPSASRRSLSGVRLEEMSKRTRPTNSSKSYEYFYPPREFDCMLQAGSQCTPRGNMEAEETRALRFLPHQLSPFPFVPHIHKSSKETVSHFPHFRLPEQSTLERRRSRCMQWRRRDATQKQAKVCAVCTGLNVTTFVGTECGASLFA